VCWLTIASSAFTGFVPFRFNRKKAQEENIEEKSILVNNNKTKRASAGMYVCVNLSMQKEKNSINVFVTGQSFFFLQFRSIIEFLRLFNFFTIFFTQFLLFLFLATLNGHHTFASNI